MASLDPPAEKENGTPSTAHANQLAAVEEQQQHDWLALIPSILERRNFHCQEQTMESAQKLIDKGLLGNFTRANENSFLSTEVEETLLESFVDNDYDGALHLTTLNDDNSSGRPIGFVFWREVPAQEMNAWIHWENLRKKLLGEQEQKAIKQQDDETHTKPTQEERDAQQHPNHKKRRMRQSIKLVRDESIRWLEVASEANKRQSLLLKSTNMAPLMKTLTHSWVKLELLAVHPDYWGKHIGTLLLACAMYQAYKKGEKHMILHVAGGPENVPALKLYEKFGFLPVPQGTVFEKPDKDLFVLGHVGESLQRLCWPALEV